jgi:hypothetical protein
VNIPLRFAVVLALCALPLLLGEMTTSKEEPGLRPVALSFSKAGDLFLLDASGRVMVISRSDQSGTPRVIATFSSSWQVSDLAVGGTDGQDHVFIIVTQGNLSQIMQYSVDGRFETSWFQIGPLSGVCTDRSSVYAASWSAGFVYRQPFSAPPKIAPKPFYRFLNMRSIGSLAWDPVGNVLFAADLQTGSVTALHLESMQPQSLADGLGQITALNYDSKGRKLYVVDGAGRTVWSVNTAVKHPKPATVLKSDQFRIPSAIAVAEDGTLWIGDPEAHALFQFSPNGKNTQPLRVIR